MEVAYNFGKGRRFSIFSYRRNNKSGDHLYGCTRDVRGALCVREAVHSERFVFVFALNKNGDIQDI